MSARNLSDLTGIPSRRAIKSVRLADTFKVGLKKVIG